MKNSHNQQSQSSIATTIAKGTVVLYENNGEQIIACILDQRGDKFFFVNYNGERFNLPNFRFTTYNLKIFPLNIAESEVVNQLKHLKVKVLEKSNSLNIKEIWSALNNSEAEITEMEIAEKVLNSKSGLDQIAIRFAIIQERIHFKRSKNKFIPRSLKDIEDFSKNEENRQKRDNEKNEFIEFVIQKIQNPQLVPTDSVREILYLLEDCAGKVSIQDQPFLKLIDEIIHVLFKQFNLKEYSSREEKCFILLNKIKYFTPLTNLSLIRHKPLINWTPELISKISLIQKEYQARIESPDLKVVDLTKKVAFTIDDDSTKDIDDAISIEQSVDGYKLYIHIANVSSLLQDLSSTSLSFAAKERATSIYCYSHKINMLPEELSEELYSLKIGKNKLAFTCEISISKDYEIRDFKFYESIINVSKKLNYEEVDKILETENTDFNILYNIASQHEEKRIRLGATKINKKELSIYPNIDGTFNLFETDESSASRHLVGELMVLYNHLLSKFAFENQLPIPYRSQQKFEYSKNSDVPAGPALDYILRNRLKRSEVSTEPLPHATLALDYYTQSTSPIRRYLDIIVQFQAISYINNKLPFFTKEDIEKFIKDVEEPISHSNLITRECRRYWLLRYLETTNISEQVYKATVIKIEKFGFLLDIDGIHISSFIKSKKKFFLGEEINIVIVAIDSYNDILRFEVVN